MAINNGADEVKRNLKKIGNIISGETDKTIGKVADEVLRRSRKIVPHDKGTLQRSGNTRKVGFANFEVGYHTPYAHRLHEHPEYKFKKGRQGKYLENPAKEMVSKLGLILSTNIKNKS